MIEKQDDCTRLLLPLFSNLLLTLSGQDLGMGDTVVEGELGASEGFPEHTIIFETHYFSL